MTQQELAEALQMTNRSVSEWETGRTTPGRDAIAKLAATFQISLDEFRRYISLDDSTELLSAEQVARKQHAIHLIDDLLADPRKLDEWVRYGEWLRERDRGQSQ